MENYLCDFLCASIAGIAGTYVGHPLDTIKVFLEHNFSVDNR